MSREDIWRRVSEAAGLDENGNILPPPKNLQIDRAASPWWTNRVLAKPQSGKATK